MRVLEGLNRSVETFLFRHGFQKREVRELMRNQLYLAVLSSLALALVTGFSTWSAGFFAGAALVTINFWALARVAPELVRMAKGAVLPLLVQFYGRLALTGVFLFVLIVWVKVSVSALLLGLATVMVNALSWGLLKSRVGQKVKEA